jgi:integrase
MGKSAPPLRRKYKLIRPGGEHLTEDQVEAVIKAAGAVGRHRKRDSLMILLAYTHGLRASELLKLQWSQINLDAGKISISRLKGSIDGDHPLREREIRALKKLSEDRRGLVFTNEHRRPLSISGFHKIVARAGRLAGINVPIHAHMLRHSCGYKLVNDGVDIKIIQVWMGHANLENTNLYTKLNATKLKGLWS